MKKTLLLAGLLALTGSLCAQSLSLCEVFEKLGNNSSDFSPLMGPATDTLEINFVSTIEVDKAEKSIFKKFLSAPYFEADYGSFQTEAEALQFVKGLQQEFLSCWGSFRFPEKYDKTLNIRDFKFVHDVENMFRVYEASLRIDQYGDEFDVSFRFPQSSDDFFSGTTPAYVDYQVLPEKEDDSPFAFSLKLVMIEAFEGFERIRGDLILDPNNYFSRYEAKFTPTGYENCYIEDRGLGIIFYTIPLLSNVEEASFAELLNTLVPKVFDALGSDYAVSQSSDGTSVTIVRKDDPVHRTGTLSISGSDGLYSVTLSLDAYR
ncbi:MAG: hypothetical protein PHE04_00315 [Bacteroidales bacterium]|nr:hypothetical protein [Bacteroidales bacterium]MDD3430887.1 hypothetical protein [Bacteroidales bacterium]MDD4361289.1 hypothetical protein [Bacteroidales bacterium]